MPLLNLILSCNVKEAALAKHEREGSTSPPWVVQDWLGQLPTLKLHTVSHWDSSLWGAPLRWSWVSPSAAVELGKGEIDCTHRPCCLAIRSLLSPHLNLSCPLRVRSPRIFSQPNPPLLVSSLVPFSHGVSFYLSALSSWASFADCPFSPLPSLFSPPLPSLLLFTIFSRFTPLPGPLILLAPTVS